MMATSDEFHVVRRRRGKKSAGKVACNAKISNSIPQSHDDDDVFDLKNFQTRLNECMQELLSSDFFRISYDAIITSLSTLIKSKMKQESEQIIKDNEESSRHFDGNLTQDIPDDTDTVKKLNVSEKNGTPTMAGNHSTDLLCYGIGKFSNCIIARYQLAFLLLLKDKLGEGKRVCHIPTIAFLPHCGKALYNNLIWANLSSSGHEGVHNLLLIGNSFSSMIERTPERQLLKTANYVKKIYPLVQEKALPLFSTHSDVFNDLALHTFPLEKSESTPAEFWTNNPKPVYDEDEAELITRTGES